MNPQPNLKREPSHTRLSDFIFVAARYAAMKEDRTEATYKKGEGIRVREGAGQESHKQINCFPE